MTDRSDRKLIEVALARYEYRHEAEFAAGFLDEAGIPYRLQIDDPVLGLAVGGVATIWVRGMDLAEAREVLEVDDEPITLSGSASPTPSREGTGARPARPLGGPMSRREPRSPRERSRASLPRLAVRERVVALLLSGGTLALTAASTGGTTTSLSYVGAVTAAILAVAGLGGRAPRPVKRWLGALGGNAP